MWSGHAQRMLLAISIQNSANHNKYTKLYVSQPEHKQKSFQPPLWPPRKEEKVWIQLYFFCIELMLIVSDNKNNP